MSHFDGFAGDAGVPSPSLYLNWVCAVLWSLGPAEPPPSTVFRYNRNKLLNF